MSDELTSDVFCPCGEYLIALGTPEARERAITLFLEWHDDCQSRLMGRRCAVQRRIPAICWGCQRCSRNCGGVGMNSNAYMAEYMNRRYHQRRARAIAILGGCCAICGSTEKLEIDHADRTTKQIDLGKRWSASESAYFAELAKCQLLCRLHHQEKSATEASVEHGGGVSGKRNCKCAPCRARKSEYNRNYRVRRASA